MTNTNSCHLNGIHNLSTGDAHNVTYSIVLQQLLYVTKCYIVCHSNGEFITFHEINNNIISKKSGYFELVPEDLYETAKKCIKVTVDNFITLDYNPKSIVCLSINTVRNVTVVWSKSTGKSVYNALAEDDIRCEEACQKLIHKSWRPSRPNFQHLCGLPISERWMGIKLRWLLDHVGSIRDLYNAEDLMAGCLDSWLIYCFSKAKYHITDVTNASYTYLMNLHRNQWDSSLLKLLEINGNILPQIVGINDNNNTNTPQYVLSINSNLCVRLGSTNCIDKASVIGHNDGHLPSHVSVHIEPYIGQMYVAIMVGDEPQYFRSTLRNLAYPIITTTVPVMTMSSSDGNPITYYCIEATLYSGQHLMSWLRDRMKLVVSSDASIGVGNSNLDSVANTVVDNGAVCILPTYHGNGVDTRVNIMNVDLNYTQPGHLVRACVEHMARDISTFLTSVSEVVNLPEHVMSIHLSGDDFLLSSDVVCQIFADMTGLEVFRLTMSESSVVGAALVAAKSVNIDPSGLQYPLVDRFSCMLTEGQRAYRLNLAGTSLISSMRDTTRNTRNKSGRSWPLKLLSVISIGVPFTLVGFGLASWLLLGKFHWSR